MNIIKQSTSFIFIIALSLLISACGGGPTAGLSLVGDNNPGNNPQPPIVDLLSNPKPPAPVITTAEATTSSVFLKWTDTSSREYGFIIVRDGIKIGETDKNISEYTDSSVLPATVYTYLVVAWNKEGEGVSPEKLVTTLFLPAPPKWILPEGADTRSFATNQVTGELYAAGMTTVALTNTPQNGREDEFLAKINSDGTIAWLKQWGTPYVDLVLGDFLAISNGNAYVLCQCNDVSGLGGGNTHVTVFNPQGDILRIIDLGDVGAGSITADDSGVYVVYGENNISYIAKIDYQASDPIVWITKMPGFVMHAKVYGGAIYVISGGMFHKMDTNTGSIFQSAAWDGQHGYVDGSAIDASGVYLVGQGVFAPLTALKYSHDLANISTRVFSAQSGLLTGSSPALSDTSIYIAVRQVGLFCLDKNTLETKWSRTDLDRSIEDYISGVAVALIGDTVLVARGNKIFHYDALTGESLL